VVPLLVKRMRLSCRVPLQLLALRLSILYLRTSVGLGYGSSLIKLLFIFYLLKNNIIFFCFVIFPDPLKINGF